MLISKRVLVALVAVGMVPATSTVQVSAAPRTAVSGVYANCPRTFTFRMFDRASDAIYLARGTQLPPKGSYAALWRMARCQRPTATDAAVGGLSPEQRALKEWARDKAVWTARRYAARNSWMTGSLGDVPGVPYWFASCVALRESTDGAESPDIYGILPMNGYFSGMSIVAQKVLFSQMYQSDGTQPWAPYDGC